MTMLGVSYQTQSADPEDLQAQDDRSRRNNYATLATSPAWGPVIADLTEQARGILDPMVRCGALDLLTYLLDSARKE